MKRQRVVRAPEPTGTVRPLTTPLMVTIGPLQQIEWNWCHTPEGSYVTGYTIISLGKNDP